MKIIEGQGTSPCQVRVSYPPVSSVAPVVDGASVMLANKTGEAYTENHADHRGDRVFRSAGIALICLNATQIRWVE